MKILQVEFLKSNRCSELITGTRSQQQIFSKNLKLFDAGKLEQKFNRRTKERQFLVVENRLINYVNTRAERHKQDKCGVLWLYLREKCNLWARTLRVEGWKKCSDGWLDKTLKRHGLVYTKLHGEANNLTDEEVLAMIAPFRIELKYQIEELGCRSIKSDYISSFNRQPSIQTFFTEK